MDVSIDARIDRVTADPKRTGRIGQRSRIDLQPARSELVDAPPQEATLRL
jgi:hypothetical protein